jgi:DNA-binding NarL/FixJ family response regulator
MLSAREKEVLELITKGFTADEIARLMQVSQHTVQTYVRRIYSKLNVNSRAEAIYEARHQGILAA